MDVPVNYLAVLACAIANMAIGFAWYGPLFGKKWSELMGWSPMTPEKMEEMKKKAMPGYAASFAGALVMAYVLSHVLVFASSYMQTSGWSAGLSSGFWMWLGFIAPITIGIVFWDGKPWTLWIINAGYWLVSILTMGVILAVWM